MVAVVELPQGATVDKLHDIVYSYVEGILGRPFRIRFVTIPDGAQLVLRFSTHV